MTFVLSLRDPAVAKLRPGHPAVTRGFEGEFISPNAEMAMSHEYDRILVYKRTHEGDPDSRTGRFGIYDCMGRVRDREFDAVIGVGGVGQKASSNGVAEIVNWVGVQPIKTREKCRFGYNVTMVRFEKFRYLVDEGIGFRDAAPRLSGLIYDGSIRHMIIDERYPEELCDARELLQLASKRVRKSDLPKTQASEVPSPCELRVNRLNQLGTR